MRLLKALDRAHHGQLHVKGQAGGDAVGVILVNREALGLEKNLVRRLVGETMDLVLDRRAITRTHAFNDTGEHRRAVEAATDCLVCALVGMGNPARQLARMLLAPTEEGKHRRRIITGLLGHHSEIDAATVDPRRRARFQPAYRQFQFAQAGRQTDRGRIPGAAALVTLQADVDQARQEGPRGQHHRAGLEAQADLRDHAGHPVALQDQVVNRLLEHSQIGLVLDTAADGLAIKDTIGLGTGRTHCRTFPRIEDSELDTGLVGGRRHRPAQRVDFLDQMALADTADRGIAGHLAQCFDTMGQQQRTATHARAGERSLGAGMTATDDDYVKFFRELRHI